MACWRRLAAATAAAAVLWAESAPPAFAHLQLMASDPPHGSVLEQPPAYVRLTFSEPIEPALFALEIYDQARRRVDARDAHLPAGEPAVLELGLPTLSVGTYTVTWRALSRDGHVLRGAYAFAVGSDIAGGAPLQLDSDRGAPFVLATVVRWLTLIAALALVGAFAFQPLVLWPALHMSGKLEPSASHLIERRLGLITWPPALLLLGLAPMTLVLQAADSAAMSPNEVLSTPVFGSLLTSTSYGFFWSVRLLLEIGVLGVIVMASAARWRHPRWIWAGMGLGSVILLTYAATGHASVVPGSTGLAIAADWLHLIAAGVWAGGLVPLTVVVWSAWRQREMTLLRPLVARFSRVAGGSVAVLLTTGAYAAVMQVASWRGVLETTYGAVLSAKLLLIVPLLLLGGVNLVVSRRRLGGGRAHGVQLLVGTIAAEVALVAAVLALTAGLTGLPPAWTTSPEGRPLGDTKDVVNYIRTPGPPRN
jgi:copper transport protein